jgi:hypothetical protein
MRSGIMDGDVDELTSWNKPVEEIIEDAKKKI